MFEEIPHNLSSRMLFYMFIDHFPVLMMFLCSVIDSPELKHSIICNFVHFIFNSIRLFSLLLQTESQLMTSPY